MERPILFSGPMVRAILEGRKMQTRRVVKGLALDWLTPPIAFSPAFVASAENRPICPYGYAGDRLWVRETWLDAGPAVGVDRALYYRADGDNVSVGPAPWRDQKWRPSIFMPRWASRLLLEIIAVRVERLQEITEADAIAEGIAEFASEKTMGQENPHRKAFLHSAHRGQTNFHALAWYRKLWDALNAKHGYSWESNPWVWVLEFRQVEAQ